MTQEKPKIRLYLPGDYAPDGCLVPTPTQTHYLVNVMRVDVGDGILVFNGKDGEWLAEVTMLAKKRVELTLRRLVRAHASSSDLWLVFAPIRNKTDSVVEKATELGVAKLLPVRTRHSVVDSVNMEKLTVHAVEAAEQCERLDVPAIETMQTLPTLMGNWPKERLLLFADESGAGAPMVDVLASLPKAPYAVLIGPEGGFSEEERHMLARLPFVKRCSMGERILRADTAAVAALACIQAVCGDWKKIC